MADSFKELNKNLSKFGTFKNNIYLDDKFNKQIIKELFKLSQVQFL